MCTRSHTDFLNCSSITFPSLGFLWRNITNFFKFCSHSHNRVDVIAQTQTTVIYTPVADWKQIKTTQHPISRALLWLIYPSWENEECIVDPIHMHSIEAAIPHRMATIIIAGRVWAESHSPSTTSFKQRSHTGAQEHRSNLIKEVSFTVLLYMCCIWLG